MILAAASSPRPGRLLAALLPAGLAACIPPVSETIGQPRLVSPRPATMAPATIDQLSRPRMSAPEVATRQAAPPPPAGTRPAMQQLPGNLAIRNEGDAPERTIGQDQRQAPSEQLYNQVADVWRSLRQQGQQPTPELIAREIGPDALARFLNTFPGSERIFGADSDILPLPPSAVPPETDPGGKPPPPAP